METNPKADQPAKTRDGVIGPTPDKGTKGSQSYGAPVIQPQHEDPPPPTGDGQTKGSQSYPVKGK